MIFPRALRRAKFRRSLGTVLVHDKSQVLRLIAGTLIREMLHSDLAAGDFCPGSQGLDMFSDFPISQHHTAAWVTAFQNFIGDLNSQYMLNQE